MVQKSVPQFGGRPDWYRNLKTHHRGDYFGSLRSLWLGQVFVTHDLMYIVYRDAEGMLSISRNACAHAGAPLFVEPGEKSVDSIRCSLHQWLYKPSGEVTFAPHFKSCEKLKLRSVEFGVWNGYVLGYSQEELDTALANFGHSLGLPREAINPEEFEYVGEIVDDVPYPRELMMVNYLDGLHVPLSHQKTFNAVTDCGTYEWELSSGHENHGLGYSIQQVYARKDVQRQLGRLMSTHKKSAEEFGWADLHLWLREKLPNIETPIDRNIFAVWGAIYGNGHLMIELYEGGLFLAVSSLVNADPQNPETGNKNPVELYIHRSVREDCRDVAKLKFANAYKQSGEEDTELCKKLWQGHRLGHMDFNRVYHEVLEAGDMHWREWFLEDFVMKG